MIPIHIDNAQQKYIEVANIRITIKQNGWNGPQRHISIRAYTGQGKRINQGPEIPIAIPAVVLDDETLLQMLGGNFISLT